MYDKMKMHKYKRLPYGLIWPLSTDPGAAVCSSKLQNRGMEPEMVLGECTLTFVISVLLYRWSDTRAMGFVLDVTRW